VPLTLDDDPRLYAESPHLAQLLVGARPIQVPMIEGLVQSPIIAARTATKPAKFSKGWSSETRASFQGATRRMAG